MSTVQFVSSDSNGESEPIMSRPWTGSGILVMLRLFGEEEAAVVVRWLFGRCRWFAGQFLSSLAPRWGDDGLVAFFPPDITVCTYRPKPTTPKIMTKKKQLRCAKEGGKRLQNSGEEL